MFPSLTDVVDFEPRAGYLWDCEFTNLNVVNGKKFPAKTVTFSTAEPIVETVKIGPDIPITYIVGYKPPESLSINFLDNKNNDIRKKIINYIKGQYSNKVDFLSRKGVSPKELIDKKIYLTVKINEYNAQLEVINTFTFMVVPDKALDLTFNDNTELQETLPLTFKIIGEV